MEIMGKVLGIILTIIGCGLVYIDYFILNAFWVLGNWITSYTNAPEELTIIIILILILVFSSFLILIIILAIYFIVWGLGCIID